jgi:hypothetical protein
MKLMIKSGDFQENSEDERRLMIGYDSADNLGRQESSV